MLRIEFARPAKKNLQSLPAKHKRQIQTKLSGLCVDPEPADSQPLKGRARGWRRATSGEYRIIYRVEGEIMKIALVGHRNDDKVYRDFERKL